MIQSRPLFWREEKCRVPDLDSSGRAKCCDTAFGCDNRSLSLLLRQTIGGAPRNQWG